MISASRWHGRARGRTTFFGWHRRWDGFGASDRIIVKEGAVIGKGSNQTEMLQDPTAHAELLAMQRAAGRLKNERLIGCTLYTTLEPCAMCAGAIVLARLNAVVYGARRPAGRAPNHRSRTIGPIMPHACGEVLKKFFRKRR